MLILKKNTKVALQGGYFEMKSDENLIVVSENEVEDKD